MRREALLVAVVLLAPNVGCQFQKAADKDLHPIDEPPDQPDGGGLDLPPPDVNVPPPVDGPLFEAETTANCIEANPQTKVIPPDALIVLDRSGSMLQDKDGKTCTGAGGAAGGGTGGRGGRPTMGGGLGDCGPDSKWTQMTTALKEILPITEGTVQWGLKYFAEGDSNSCTVTNGAAVAPKLTNASAIAMSIDGTRPASATPTTAAMKSATAYLLGLNDESPKFILLATDGLPTCGSGQDGADVDAAIAAVKDAKAMGIPTFVIGIATAGMGSADDTLTKMANEGGFARTDTPAYYSVSSAADLKDAFSKISGMVGVCYFSVNPVPKDIKDITDVKGDDKIIPQDATDGWTFVTMPNSAGVQLNGKACEDYKSGNIKTVKVDLPCIVL
jgi:hypothetical protein